MWTAERVQRWEEAVERLAAATADDSIRDSWRPRAAAVPGHGVDPGAARHVPRRRRGTTRCTPCSTSSRTAGCAAARRAGSAGPTSTWTPARLTVRRQLVQVGWDSLRGHPEVDAGERTIALDAGTVAALRTHRRRQLAAGWSGVRRGWTPARCSPARTARALHPATVTDRFHALAAAAKLPPIRLHDLRHGAASLMLAAGCRRRSCRRRSGTRTLGAHARHLHERLHRGGGRGCGGRRGARPARRRHGAAHTSHTHRRRANPRQRETAGQAVGRVGLEPTT